jgi:hypothetical protein
MFDPIDESVVELPDYARFGHHGLVVVDVEFCLLLQDLRELHVVVHVLPEDVPQLICVFTCLRQLQVDTDQLWDRNMPISVVVKHLKVDFTSLIYIALEGDDEATNKV